MTKLTNLDFLGAFGKCELECAAARVINENACLVDDFPDDERFCLIYHGWFDGDRLSPEFIRRARAHIAGKAPVV